MPATCSTCDPTRIEVGSLQMAEQPKDEVEALKHDLEEARRSLKDSEVSADGRVKALKDQLRDAKRKAKALIEIKIKEGERECQNFQVKLEESAKHLGEARRKISTLEDEVAEAGVVKSQLTASKDMLKDMGAKLQADRILIDDMKSRMKQQDAVNEENGRRLRVEKGENHALTKQVESLKARLEDYEKASVLASEGSLSSSNRLANGQLDHAESAGDCINMDSTSDESRFSGTAVDKTAKDFSDTEPLGSLMERENSRQRARMARELAILQISVAALTTSHQSVEEELGPHITEKDPRRSRTESRNAENPVTGNCIVQLESRGVNLENAQSGQPSADVPLELSRDSSRETEDTKDELHRAKMQITEYIRELEVIRNERSILTKRVKKLEGEIRGLNQAIPLECSNDASRVSKPDGEQAPSSENYEMSRNELQSKVEELEGKLSAKQTEIGKVRDRARAYLKELNAKKRDMEKKMKTDMGALKSTLKTQEEEKAAIERKYSDLESELSRYLEVIGEKQRALQSAHMRLASEKSLRETAMEKEEVVRCEFEAYKERAKSALEERNALISNAQRSTESATRDLRKRLTDATKEIQDLRSALNSAKRMESDMSAVVERANKAEAALDLLQSERLLPKSESFDDARKAQERLATVEKELAHALHIAEDSKTRGGTALVRLEVAERALKSAEQQHEKESARAHKQVEELMHRVATLEKALERARESAKSAQRTAAAAAKAMTHSGLIENELDHTSTVNHFSKERSMNDLSDEEVKDEAAKQSSHNDQTAILMAQIAELSTMVRNAEEEATLREGQVDLLKSEVQDLEAKLVAAERLQNNAPFRYLKNIVVRYLETGDSTLLPVLAKVLGLSEDETAQIGGNARRGSQAGGRFFSIPFLGGG